MLILWTDALIYVLLITGGAAALYLWRQEPMRRPLRKIAASPVAMASLTILIMFSLIGVADSIHFRDNASRGNEALSLLDAATTRMRTQTEKTYSAPFAAYSLQQRTFY
jgi:peptide/nickel transport system permease protein